MSKIRRLIDRIADGGTGCIGYNVWNRCGGWSKDLVKTAISSGAVFFCTFQNVDWGGNSFTECNKIWWESFVIAVY